MSTDSTPLTAEELAAIQARLDAITAPPLYDPFDLGDSVNWTANLNFIAHIGEDVPRLLATIEAQQTELAAMREIVKRVAAIPVESLWGGNSVELFDTDYLGIYDEDATGLVEQARALAGAGKE